MSKLGELFDRIPDGGTLKAMGAYGTLLKTLANHQAGFFAVEWGHRAAAQVLAELVKVTNAHEGRDAVDVVREFVEKGLHEITEFEDSAPEEFVFSFDRCPYGLRGPEHADLCHAVMNLEETAVARMGGEFITAARIPEGADRCRFRVRNAGG